MLTAVETAECRPLPGWRPDVPLQGVTGAKLSAEALGRHRSHAPSSTWSLPASLACGHITSIFVSFSRLCLLRGHLSLHLRPTWTFQDVLLVSKSPTKSHLQRPFFK